MTSSELSKVVRDCLRNKRKAQKELYEYFAPIMLSVCYRYTKNLPDAENILQEGFIRVFTNLHKFRHEGEIGAWIRRIMVNCALTYLKKNGEYRNEMAFGETYLHPVSDENPEVRMDGKELSGLIRQLPAGYQTIFNLYAVEGYSHVEISGMLGINQATSRSQYARARSLLIQWLDEISFKEKGGNYGK